jgi:hypothetical protein
MICYKSRGAFIPSVTRTSDKDHWRIYHDALRGHAHLVDALYKTIQGKAAHMDAVINSSQLGAEILPTWNEKETLLKAYPNVEDSNGLFGQILWTVLFDDLRRWIVVNAKGKGNLGKIYFQIKGPISPIDKCPE